MVLLFVVLYSTNPTNDVENLPPRMAIICNDVLDEYFPDAKWRDEVWSRISTVENQIGKWYPEVEEAWQALPQRWNEVSTKLREAVSTASHISWSQFLKMSNKTFSDEGTTKSSDVSKGGSDREADKHCTVTDALSSDVNSVENATNHTNCSSSNTAAGSSVNANQTCNGTDISNNTNCTITDGPPQEMKPDETETQQTEQTKNLFELFSFHAPPFLSGFDLQNATNWIKSDILSKSHIWLKWEPSPSWSKWWKKWTADVSGETNYVLFSLQRISGGVKMAALLHRYQICHHGRGKMEESLCKWIADNMCHGKHAFDRKQRPFTAHRVLAAAILISGALSWCSQNRRLRFATSLDHPLSLVLSVFYRPSLLESLVTLNIIVYPCLLTMDRVMSLGTTNSTTATWYFFLSIAFLFGIIGGVSNLVASIIVRREVYGMKGAVAAALGYLLAVSPSKAVVRYQSIEMTAADVLLGVTIFYGLSLLTVRRYGGSLVSWVIGAIAGNAFSTYLLGKFGLGWFPF